MHHSCGTRCTYRVHLQAFKTNEEKKKKKGHGASSKAAFGPRIEK